MGYMRHHAIIVTSWNENHLREIRKYAKNLFSHLTSEIVFATINGYGSFMIAPDGSKEGWITSNDYNDKRDMFIKFIENNRDALWCDYVEIQFGDEEGNQKVLRASNKND